ncbi:MAG TPA: HAMP domain-containing sensor histidine kinase [Syntrophorhabdaceae bacterium]|nr:HAMP domain-containing sensor histidine kinase [Syntrophorhabdaceae bacterium]
MRLSTKILLFFVSLVVLLSIVTTYSGISSIEQIAVNELEKNLTSDINLITFALDREFNHIETHLTLLSMRNTLKNAIARRDTENIRELLGAVLQNENIDIINLTDNNGTPIAAVKNRFKNISVSIPHMDTQDVSKGFTVIDAGDGKRVALFVSMRLKKQKAILSELVILDNISPFIRGLSDLLARKRDEPVYISIFNNDKRMFSTIFTLTGTHTQNLPGEVTAALYKEKKNYIGKTLIGKASYYTIYKALKYGEEFDNWSYGLAVSENIFLPFKKRLLFIFVMISVLATSAVIVITLFITRGIGPSLGSILDICGSIEKGDTLSRIDEKNIKINEFSLIASSINKMLDSISEREHIIGENIEKIKAINAELEEKTQIIRQDRVRFLAILETMDDGIAAVDHQGIITYFNRAAETITGVERAAVLGNRYQGLFPPLSISENKHTVVEELVLEKDQLPLYLRMFVSPYILENDRQGHILLFQDISREKKIDEFKADFVSSITHDIKSFLMPVAGFLARILGGKYGTVEDPLREKLAAIMENISKTQHLVENYLNVSRIESGKLDLVVSPIDLSEVIRDIAGLYGQRVQYADAGDTSLVLADKTYIERVIVNLVVNALKFSPEDAGVLITTRKENDMIITSVADRGIGIPPSELPYIFEKYRRGSFGKKEDGSGLGLFIVKSVIEGHGGSIRVESAPGKGSTFYFSLPVFLGEI